MLYNLCSPITLLLVESQRRKVMRVGTSKREETVSAVKNERSMLNWGPAQTLCPFPPQKTLKAKQELKGREGEAGVRSYAVSGSIT